VFAAIDALDIILLVSSGVPPDGVIHAEYVYVTAVGLHAVNAITLVPAEVVGAVYKLVADVDAGRMPFAITTLVAIYQNL
jgi:hypothetical protein